MSDLAPSRFPDIWMSSLFNSRSAKATGFVRRRLEEIDKIVGVDNFLEEVERRGFHAFEQSGQMIVLCDTSPVEVRR